VPARPKSTNKAVAQPSIVLLEEYDALEAAIGSALKKFAPNHAVALARTLKELEKFANDLEPDLFILDVDPPWSGITELLEKLRDSHPAARVLVIGTAIPPEIAAERGSFGGLQFVEKPYELATFGAAVQALLGPWRESESRGTLRALSGIDLVLLHCAAGANVILDIHSRARSGQIEIAAGQVVHAETGKIKGENALAQILGWPRASFGERRTSGASRRTIATGWSAGVLEALGQAQPEAPEPPRARVTQALPEVGKKIVVIDDTEMLLIFVEDVLATAEPDLRITTAVSASEGLREIERTNPDLVLLDYSLPDFNGDEVCRRLLESEQTANIPVLMMSGHVQQMRATAARFPNVVAAIEKPFLSEALVDLVRRTLAGERKLTKKITKPAVAPTVIEPSPTPAPIAQPKPSPPPRQEIIAESPVRETREPVLTHPVVSREPVRVPIEPRIEQGKPSPTTPAVRVAAPTDGSGAVLGLFLEVLSMQLTSQLQMGAIRARPASLMASLRLESAAARNAIPAETGFQIGTAQFSAEGRISSLRLLPTAKPLQPAQMRNAFDIGGVAVIPNETRARVQLTPSGTTPMTMELLAHLELSAVELTQNFQLAQLILNWPTSAVRVTLNPKAPEQSAAKFEMRVEKLDSDGRITELLLSPIR
jgi:DNA-binding response OmpR family regulator